MTTPQSPSSASSAPTESRLSAMDVAILEMESRRFKYRGAKERTIRQELQISVTSYYQQLNALIDASAAWAAYPALMRRLRDYRDGGVM